MTGFILAVTTIFIGIPLFIIILICEIIREIWERSK